MENWGGRVWEAPTAATSLTVTSTTSNSASLSWTAATDNVAVTGYDIYVNGTLWNWIDYDSNWFNCIYYLFLYIVTRDAEKNSSVPSSTVQGITKIRPQEQLLVHLKLSNNSANASSYTTNMD
jgi:hypothetical protein